MAKCNVRSAAHTPTRRCLLALGNTVSLHATIISAHSPAAHSPAAPVKVHCQLQRLSCPGCASTQTCLPLLNATTNCVKAGPRISLPLAHLPSHPRSGLASAARAHKPPDLANFTPHPLMSEQAAPACKQLHPIIARALRLRRPRPAWCAAPPVRPASVA